MKSSVVPEDWKASCIVPVYKGKGDRRDCANYRRRSILSIPGRIYGRVLISSDEKYERTGSGGAMRIYVV